MEKLPYSFGEHDQQVYEFVNTVEQLWPEWDYHNFSGHAVETAEDFLKQVKYCRDNGQDISEDEVLAGILASFEHDAGNQWGELMFLQYPEERSANIGDGLAAGLDISANVIAMKRSATLATRPGSKCTSLLDRRVRRADLANLAWPYDKFKAKTIDFWRETQKQSEQPLSFQDWLPKAAIPLLMLLDEDLAFGDFDRGDSGESLFHEAAYCNFRELNDEVESDDFIEPELELAA